ncbi:MAG: type II toxin-antitoxin system RelE/ParE family toxin [Candidatus Dojkabacteria bacterium]|nr:type II toxin-antitoxin system RelE/ParE family toxin [Candidatus Dojkabacteria bacterium]MDQ7020985.1 type II toxin-antitoxin system RelE/ParE family toxin [Candidatus Dojkabacteria bacterium]
MIKHYYKVDKELEKLPSKVRNKFFAVFNSFIANEQLKIKTLKKLKGSRFYEFRIRVDRNIYRSITVKVSPNIYVLLVFHKKSQKTPMQVLNLASKRYKDLFIK